MNHYKPFEEYIVKSKQLLSHNVYIFLFTKASSYL